MDNITNLKTPIMANIKININDIHKENVAMGTPVKTKSDELTQVKSNSEDLTPNQTKYENMSTVKNNFENLTSIHYESENMTLVKSRSDDLTLIQNESGKIIPTKSNSEDLTQVKSNFVYLTPIQMQSENIIAEKNSLEILTQIKSNSENLTPIQNKHENMLTDKNTFENMTSIHYESENKTQVKSSSKDLMSIQNESENITPVKNNLEDLTQIKSSFVYLTPIKIPFENLTTEKNNFEDLTSKQTKHENMSTIKNNFEKLTPIHYESENMALFKSSSEELEPIPNELGNITPVKNNSEDLTPIQIQSENIITEKNNSEISTLGKSNTEDLTLIQNKHENMSTVKNNFENLIPVKSNPEDLTLIQNESENMVPVKNYFNDFTTIENKSFNETQEKNDFAILTPVKIDSEYLTPVHNKYANLLPVKYNFENMTQEKNNFEDLTSIQNEFENMTPVKNNFEDLITIKRYSEDIPIQIQLINTMTDRYDFEMSTPEKNYFEDLSSIKNPLKMTPLINDPNNLTENTEDFIPEKTVVCYCNKERNYNTVELLCANCHQWYHDYCIELQLENLVPFMTNYIFICKNCSSTDLESFKKYRASFSQICVTALGNLMQTNIKNGNSQLYFSVNKDIMPFVNLNWGIITTVTKKANRVQYVGITRALKRGADTLFDIQINTTNAKLYKLLLDVSEIKPNYESMFKNGKLIVTEFGVQIANIERRSSLRIAGDGISDINKHKNEENKSDIQLICPKYPSEHPFNKNGYRYTLAEPDPHASFKQKLDKLNEYAKYVIPGWLYRPVCPNQVLLSLYDRAPQLHISDDRLSVTGKKGYCMVRATHSVSSGNWYWEVTVEEMPDNSACRIGWGQKYANLQTPLGFDKFGYSWRSRKGTVFHESRGKHYSNGFGKGDTLGMMICLPNNSVLPGLFYKNSMLIKYKNHLYFEVSENTRDVLKTLKPLIGSKILYYKNGNCCNEGAVNLNEGSYFPSLSLYKNCVLSVNFGPDFKYPPLQTDEFKYKGMWERANETVCEETMADLIFFTENDGKLKLNDI